ncbi:MAG: hypothetical protein JWO38_1512 [Gemmataceae bacterium]|nr:hypothetical protein [Gemmataceae bacterium]
MAEDIDRDDDYTSAPAKAEPNKKITAGILALLLGGLGVHKFYLGYTKAGIIQILSNIACGAGSIIALIEGILYLTKDDKDFYQTYQVGKKEWF